MRKDRRVRDRVRVRWRRTFWSYTLLLAVAWTAVVGASLVWNLYQHRESLYENARQVARTALRKDVLYRRWVAEHGGVYIPRREDAAMNRYLPDDVPATIQDETGQEYLLVNPTSLTRSIYQMEPDALGIAASLTSLAPVNPDNAPDEWERKALLYLEATRAGEYSEIVTQSDGLTLRLIRPLYVEAACLKCHQQQGYQLGQVRGAISQSIPLAPILASGAEQDRSLVWAHLGLWAFGLATISVAAYRLHTSARQRQEAEARLEYLSTHDALTGLYNRTYFESVIAELAARESSPVSVIVADVDYLKEVNDSQGHQAGDRLILAAAELLREHFRDGDILARIGGDEFVVILPDTDARTANQILRRVRAQISQTRPTPSATGQAGVSGSIPEEDESLRLSLSLGAATSDHATELLEIFKQADREMYAEKFRKKQRRLEPGRAPKPG